MKEHFAKLPSEEETQRSVQIFKAFGDYTRYKILYLLYARELSVSEITSEIGVSQSAISHQLKLLRQTGLVSGRRDGQRILYSLADKHIIMIFGCIIFRTDNVKFFYYCPSFIFSIFAAK